MLTPRTAKLAAASTSIMAISAYGFLHFSTSRNERSLSSSSSSQQLQEEQQTLLPKKFELPRSITSSSRRKGRKIISPSFTSLLATDDKNDINLPLHASDASPSIETKTKLLQDRFFRVGDYYVWLYQDKDGIPTSWEKYTITKKTKNEDGEDVMMIEMSTKFTEDEPYITHHRMTVNLKDHLNTFESGKEGWKLCNFEYSDGTKWIQFGQMDNVQAFEEKFDVFSMLSMTNKYDADTRIMKLGGNDLTLLRSGRHNYTDAWYAPSLHPKLAGIALWKQFKEHTFSLIQMGSVTTTMPPIEVDIRDC